MSASRHQTARQIENHTYPDETTLTIDGIAVHLSHQHKVYFPAQGITKGEVARYYQRMAPFILPYLQDRPQSLRRNPNGILDQGFFHKDMGSQAPAWADTVLLPTGQPGETVNYLLCNNTATLLYMNNLGCIEVNPWFSRIDKLDYPDYCVIDIDPSPHNSFEEVVDAALAVKQVLEKAGAVGYPKTSGATGLHVYIPLGAKYSYEQSEGFANLIAVLAADILPDTTSVERSIIKRGSKIYLDYMQNEKGQTLAAPYSIRPRPGATAATPLDWSELTHRLSPAQFTIRNLAQRAESLGDIFAPVLGKGIDLEKCLDNLSR